MCGSLDVDACACLHTHFKAKPTLGVTAERTRNGSCECVCMSSRRRQQRNTHTDTTLALYLNYRRARKRDTPPNPSTYATRFKCDRIRSQVRSFVKYKSHVSDNSSDYPLTKNHRVPEITLTHTLDVGVARIVMLTNLTGSCYVDVCVCCGAVWQSTRHEKGTSTLHDACTADWVTKCVCVYVCLCWP